MKQDGYALITGASRGLGMAFARAIAERRYNLVLVARSPEPLETFAADLRQFHPVSVVTIHVDLSSPGAGQILAEQLSSGHIPVDLLVNNAGFGLRGEFRDLSLPRQLEMLRLNNQAIVELTYSLLPGCWNDRERASSISPQRQAFSRFPLPAPTPQLRPS
jgi:short-subunit dehydrogenase